MLPLVAIAMLLVVQVALLVWDQLRVVHAAREGARVLATTNDAAAATASALEASRLDEARAEIVVTPERRPAGTPARVRVSYRPRIVVPFAGRFASGIVLSASVGMRVERDPP